MASRSGRKKKLETDDNRWRNMYILTDVHSKLRKLYRPTITISLVLTALAGITTITVQNANELAKPIMQGMLMEDMTHSRD